MLFILFQCQYVKRENFGGAMMWTLDMDDFNGQFCRKNKKQLIHRFPLISAMKEELEIQETTTISTTLPISTATLTNQTNESDDQIQVLLDQLFVNASSSSSRTDFLWKKFLSFSCLTSSYLIGSTIYIVA